MVFGSMQDLQHFEVRLLNGDKQEQWMTCMATGFEGARATAERARPGSRVIQITIIQVASDEQN
jgi:hypothetical protein